MISKRCLNKTLLQTKTNFGQYLCPEGVFKMNDQNRNNKNQNQNQNQNQNRNGQNKKNDQNKENKKRDNFDF